MAVILDRCPGVLFYIDDVIVFGKTAEEHLLNLKTALQKIKDAGLKLNNKCVFDVPELAFLGHKVTARGISPLPEKIDSIVNTPVPTDVAALRSFLGLVEYYSKFVPRLAQVVEPMRVLLRKNEPFIWSAEADNSFRRVKKCFRRAQSFKCSIRRFQSLYRQMLPTVGWEQSSSNKMAKNFAQSLSHLVHCPQRRESIQSGNEKHWHVFGHVSDGTRTFGVAILKFAQTTRRLSPCCRHKDVEDARLESHAGAHDCFVITSLLNTAGGPRTLLQMHFLGCQHLPQKQSLQRRKKLCRSLSQPVWQRRSSDRPSLTMVV